MTYIPECDPYEKQSILKGLDFTVEISYKDSRGDPKIPSDGWCMDLCYQGSYIDMCVDHKLDDGR